MAKFGFWRKRIYTAVKKTKGGIPNSRFSTSDVVQESMLGLLKENQKNGDREFNDAYLHKVGEGNTNRLIRTNLAQRRSIRCETSSETDNSFVKENKSPLDLMADREQVVELIHAIACLPELQQTIIYRRYFDRKSWQEIADEVVFGVDATRRLCSKSLKQLRRTLQG